MKEWAKVNLPVEVAEKIQETMNRRKDLGYKSVSDFVLDAVRERLRQIEHEETQKALAKKA